jgi:hypothetical protein
MPQPSHSTISLASVLVSPRQQPQILGKMLRQSEKEEGVHNQYGFAIKNVIFYKQTILSQK